MAETAKHNGHSEPADKDMKHSPPGPAPAIGPCCGTLKTHQAGDLNALRREARDDEGLGKKDGARDQAGKNDLSTRRRRAAGNEMARGQQQAESDTKPDRDTKDRPKRQHQPSPIILKIPYHRKRPEAGIAGGGMAGPRLGRATSIVASIGRARHGESPDRTGAALGHPASRRIRKTKVSCSSRGGRFA